MPYPNATTISSLSVALMLPSLCLPAILRAADSDNQGIPTVQFVYYRSATIPLAMDAPPRKNIYPVSTRNTREKQLTKDGHSFNPVLSPDGTHIAYLHVTADTCEDCLVAPKYEINVMNADGTEPRTLVSDGDTPARLLAENATGLFNKLKWSPDGKWLAYSCRGPKETGKRRFSLCILGTGQQAEALVLTENGDFLRSYSWSPDGTQIVYSTFDPQTNKLRKDPYSLLVVRTDGSAPRLLTTTKNGVTTPQWSPEGKTIVFCDRERKGGVVEVINADGTGKVRLTEPKLNASTPIWPPDGKELAFTAPVHGKLQVHLMNSDGSQLRVLTRSPKLSCSNVTWLQNTRLLLLRCGYTVAPYGATVGIFVDGEYYLISDNDTGGAPRQLAERGAMAISFALETKREEQESSSTH
jgi:Tol biopolymer transport system component